MINSDELWKLVYIFILFYNLLTVFILLVFISIINTLLLPQEPTPVIWPPSTEGPRAPWPLIERSPGLPTHLAKVRQSYSH